MLAPSPSPAPPSHPATLPRLTPDPWPGTTPALTPDPAMPLPSVLRYLAVPSLSQCALRDGGLCLYSPLPEGWCRLHRLDGGHAEMGSSHLCNPSYRSVAPVGHLLRPQGLAQELHHPPAAQARLLPGRRRLRGAAGAVRPHGWVRAGRGGGGGWGGGGGAGSAAAAGAPSPAPRAPAPSQLLSGGAHARTSGGAEGIHRLGCCTPAHTPVRSRCCCCRRCRRLSR